MTLGFRPLSGRVVPVLAFAALLGAGVLARGWTFLPESIPRPGVCDASDPDYMLGCVEFNDDGRLREPQQVEDLLARIRLMGRDHSLAIVAFMHGWNNNCDDCNPYLNCFRVSMKALGKLSRRYDRKVVGVYLNWRGVRYRPPAYNKAVSFWGRDQVAGNIGRNGYLLDVLYRLSKEKERLPKGGVLIASGHSLGAKALFEAYRGEIEQTMVEDVTRRAGTSKFSELVILMNPAFSAAEYAFIDQVAAHQYGSSPDVPPHSLIVSSETDQVTATIYPLSFATWWMPWTGDQERIRFTTVGNHLPYRTHRLLISEGLVAKARGMSDPCGCPQVSEEDISQVLMSRSDPCEYRSISYSNNGPRYSLRLQNEPRRRGPYYVVQVDRGILDGHGQIFTPAFVDFLLRTVNARFYCGGR